MKIKYASAHAFSAAPAATTPAGLPASSMPPLNLVLRELGRWPNPACACSRAPAPPAPAPSHATELATGDTLSIPAAAQPTTQKTTGTGLNILRKSGRSVSDVPVSSSVSSSSTSSAAPTTGLTLLNATLLAGTAYSEATSPRSPRNARPPHAGPLLPLSIPDSAQPRIHLRSPRKRPSSRAKPASDEVLSTQPAGEDIPFAVWPINAPVTPCPSHDPETPQLSTRKHSTLGSHAASSAATALPLSLATLYLASVPPEALAPKSSSSGTSTPTGASTALAPLSPVAARARRRTSNTSAVSASSAAPSPSRHSHFSLHPKVEHSLATAAPASGTQFLTPPAVDALRKRWAVEKKVAAQVYGKIDNEHTKLYSYMRPGWAWTYGEYTAFGKAQDAQASAGTCTPQASLAPLAEHAPVTWSLLRNCLIPLHVARPPTQAPATKALTTQQSEVPAEQNKRPNPGNGLSSSSATASISPTPNRAVPSSVEARFEAWRKAVDNKLNAQYPPRAVDAGIELWAAKSFLQHDFAELANLLNTAPHHRALFKEWLWSLVSHRHASQATDTALPDTVFANPADTVKVSQQALCALFSLVQQDGIDARNIVLHKHLRPQSFLLQYASAAPGSAHYSALIHALVAAWFVDVFADDVEAKTNTMTKDEFMVLADLLVRCYACYPERIHGEAQYDVVQTKHANRPQTSGNSGGAMMLAFDRFAGTPVAIRPIARKDALVGQRGPIAVSFALKNSPLACTELHVMQILGEHPNVAGVKDVLVTDDQVLFVHDMHSGGSLLEWCLANMSSSAKKAQKHFDITSRKEVFTMRVWKRPQDLTPDDVAKLSCEDTEPFMSEDCAKSVMRDVLSAISYCHSRGVAHRDIRLDNILLNESGAAVLTSFGKAMTFENGFDMFDANELASKSPAYMAPEQLLNPRCCRGKAIDIWSIGVTLVWLLTGRSLYPQKEMADLFPAVRAGSFVAPTAEQASPDALDIISLMLQSDPEKRPSAQELLNHPWFSTSTVAKSSLTSAMNLYHVPVEFPCSNKKALSAGVEKALRKVLSNGDIHFRECELLFDSEIFRYQCIWPEHDLRFGIYLTRGKVKKHRKRDVSLQLYFEKIDGRGVVFTQANRKISQLVFDSLADFVEDDFTGGDFTPTSTPSISNLLFPSERFPDRGDSGDFAYDLMSEDLDDIAPVSPMSQGQGSFSLDHDLSLGGRSSLSSDATGATGASTAAASGRLGNMPVTLRKIAEVFKPKPKAENVSESTSSTDDLSSKSLNSAPSSVRLSFHTKQSPHTNEKLDLNISVNSSLGGSAEDVDWERELSTRRYSDLQVPDQPRNAVGMRADQQRGKVRKLFEHRNGSKIHDHDTDYDLFEDGEEDGPSEKEPLSRRVKNLFARR